MGGPLGRRPLGRKFIGLACHAQGGQIPLFCSTGEDERDSERGWVGERERESECVCVCLPVIKCISFKQGFFSSWKFKVQR